MTTYNKKDIILVPFPFSELTYAKKRPALVLASIPSRDELIGMMLVQVSSSLVISKGIFLPLERSSSIEERSLTLSIPV